MLWQCTAKHNFLMTWSDVTVGHWCPECARISKSSNIEECHNFAKIQHNGKCLESVYVNSYTNMLWECEKGHQWAACWHNIRSRNSWCPKCASFKTEYKCKELLEIKLGLEFIKTRFYYDINNKRKFYEFDGYNKEHKVAFEYHGEQHYIYPNYWHKTLKIYEKAIKRDSDKVKYAEENNIKLIIIPYTENDRLEEYVKELL